MKPGTVILEIERIVAGGAGLARTSEGVVLVRGCLPGETVTARPRLVNGVLRAFAIDILSPHPDRSDLDLPPGADLPLAYPAQLGVKRELVVEALGRVSKIEAEVAPVQPSPRQLGYRGVAQYAVLPEGGLAARAVSSDRSVPLKADPLVAPPVQRAFDACADRPLPGIKEVVLRGSLHEGRALVGLIGDLSPSLPRVARTLLGAGVAGVTWAESDPRGRFRGRTKALGGETALLEDLGGILASVSVSSFSQVNPLAAGDLFRAAAEAAGGGARALDLYAGSGALALHLAPSFDEVIAIEIAGDAIRRGRADARRLSLTNLEFKQADAKTASEFFPADVVVVDPPRAGMSSATIALLSEQQPGRIVHVSCDPTTWARDCGLLARAGYRLTVVRPYDFYPYTHHVEVLSVLEL